MLDEDPLVTVRKILVENWDEDNTVLADVPRFQTGWYDFGSDDPQVTITNSDEGVVEGLHTGQTAATGAGGVHQIRSGMMLVNCWSGTYDDMQGMGDGGEDISPKQAAWDMAKEVHRIIQENASGTTDEDGNQQLQSLGAEDIRRIVDTDRDPAVFRYEVTVLYTYGVKTE